MSAMTARTRRERSLSWGARRSRVGIEGRRGEEVGNERGFEHLAEP